MAGGRPTKYNKSFSEQAYKLCLLGATDAELADFFGVKESTINMWKKTHKEFSESVIRGKDIADAEVAASFHKRAVGYTYQEVVFEKIDGKENLEATPAGLIAVEQYKKKITVKELPADPGAALNWLKNRQPGKWRDKQEIDHTTKGEKLGSQLPALTFEQLKELKYGKNPDNTNG